MRKTIQKHPLKSIFAAAALAAGLTASGVYVIAHHGSQELKEAFVQVSLNEAAAPSSIGKTPQAADAPEESRYREYNLQRNQDCAFGEDAITTDGKSCSRMYDL